MRPILYTIIFGILTACGAPSNSNTNSTEPEVKTKAVEADLAQLYQHYHSNPASQFEMDENQIIDHIADLQQAFSRSASGLYYSIQSNGTEPTIQRGQAISAHYTGYLLDGSIFDSSHKRKEPIQFKIGQMIAGWNEILPSMRKGDTATLLVPSYLAYGPEGFDGYIDPNTPLKFVLEIVDVQ